MDAWAPGRTCAAGCEAMGVDLNRGRAATGARSLELILRISVNLRNFLFETYETRCAAGSLEERPSLADAKGWREPGPDHNRPDPDDTDLKLDRTPGGMDLSSRYLQKETPSETLEAWREWIGSGAQAAW